MSTCAWIATGCKGLTSQHLQKHFTTFCLARFQCRQCLSLFGPLSFRFYIIRPLPVGGRYGDRRFTSSAQSSAPAHHWWRAEAESTEGLDLLHLLNFYNHCIALLVCWWHSASCSNQCSTAYRPTAVLYMDLLELASCVIQQYEHHENSSILCKQ